MARIRRARPGLVPLYRARAGIAAARRAARAGQPGMAPNLVGKPSGFTMRRAASIPATDYKNQIRTQIQGGYGTALISASGTATISVGPHGLGTIWYPQAVALSTTSGADDGSTCALYLSPLQNFPPAAPMTQIGGQSYNGGGDTIGIAVPPMWPGYFITAIWSGGTTGDLAAIQVYGDQDALAL